MKRSDLETAFKTVFTEAITVPIEIGDTILTGRFKNHKVVVKDITQDEDGNPLVNGRQILKIKLKKQPNIFKKEGKMSKLNLKQIIRDTIKEFSDIEGMADYSVPVEKGRQNNVSPNTKHGAKIKEGRMADIDILAQEAKDLKEFIVSVKKTYPGLFKNGKIDFATAGWLKKMYEDSIESKKDK